ncbi:solute carrier organic anion transporter family member 4C1-like isoform X2 [Actinia tenebrosa]|uniref:Solute carrier organic anion transporter family member n=1 Tax=Actinia tenebrosa TaxID=6105 RepID=A0A6P8GZQ5_ACTTE|nr:solute carrier organic anion transporter family member 4C1-like isoform X2 [Actinia tenebrosa]
MASNWKEKSPSEETLKSLEGVRSDNQNDCFLVQSEESTWGWFAFRPRCLQWLNSSRFLMAVLFFLTITQGMVSLTFVPMSLPSLERRFLLNSKQTDYDPQSVSTKSLPFCVSNKTFVAKDEDCLTTARSSSSYYFIFILAQLLSGVGSSPLLSLAPAWLDENVHPKHTGLYLGMFFTAFIIGPGIGTMIGGKLLEVYVDIKMPPGLQLRPLDHRWIGAWWLGPFVFAFFLIISGFILLGFPSKVPGAVEMREEAIKNKYIIGKDNNLQGRLKDIVPATKSLFTNKVYIFQICGMISGTFAWYGAGPFLYKIIRDRYGAPQFLAGLFMSILSLIGGNVGVWIGSAVVRGLGLRDSCRKAAKFVFFANIFTMSILSFLVPGCEYPRYAGVDVPYPNSSLGQLQLSSSCNINCHCTTNQYSPMCDSRGVNFFSPCYAGCSPLDAKKGFANCSCTSIPSKLTMGPCKKRCSYLYLFVGYLFIMTVIGVCDQIPSDIVLFRSVPDNQRSYGLGIQFVLSKLMAALPGPIIIGYIIDETCSLWKTKCSQRGNCLNYDYDKLGWIIVSYGLPLKALSLMFYFLSWYYCKELEIRVATTTDDVNKTESNCKSTAV